MTIAHNSITDTLGASIVLGDALEGVIEDNPLTNSGQGILIAAYGPYGGPAAYGPVMNTDVLRNTIAVGAGDLIAYDHGSYVWGIGIKDFPGCLLSGLMVRDNVVPSVNFIYSANGVNGVSASVIEQNTAYWEPTFRSPVFLFRIICRPRKRWIMPRQYRRACGIYTGKRSFLYFPEEPRFANGRVGDVIVE